MQWHLELFEVPVCHITEVKWVAKYDLTWIFFQWIDIMPLSRSYYLLLIILLLDIKVQIYNLVYSGLNATKYVVCVNISVPTCSLILLMPSGPSRLTACLTRSVRPQLSIRKPRSCRNFASVDAASSFLVVQKQSSALLNKS